MHYYDLPDEFTKSYVQAALWSSNYGKNRNKPIDSKYSCEHIRRDTIKVMIADCREFQEKYGSLITAENCLCSRDYEGMAGHDFWMTRNGHGVGFWERGDWTPEAGTKLTAAAKSYGSVDLWVQNGRVGHN